MRTLFFLQRQPLKCKYLRFSSARVRTQVFMSILKRQVNSSSNFASFFIAITNKSTVKFKLIHFLLWIKESVKVQILRLSSALVKISQIPHIVFENKSHFPTNFASIFSTIKHKSSVLF